MKRILMATVAAAAFTATGALAADIPARMPTKAPAYVAGYNWTGPYVGVNLGAGFGDIGFGNNTTGFIYGAQIGYNWQGMGSPWVFGLEADFQGSTQRSSGTSVIGGSFNSKLPWFGTVRGRLGYAFDRAMIYATGGLAYQHLKLDGTFGGVSGSASETRAGWTLGGGIEWALWDRWTAKVEYLHIHTKGVDLTLAGNTFTTGDVHNNIVRAGLNYRF